MKLTLRQTAERLGKSVRQVRYMIQHGQLKARKDGRWVVEVTDIPLSRGQQQARERRDAQLKSAVEDALDLGKPKRRFSLFDLRAFKVGTPIYREARGSLGVEHPAVTALHRGLMYLAQGCHRFGRTDKVGAYRLARDELSVAACELALAEQEGAAQLQEKVEQEFLGALAGLLHRVEQSSHLDVDLGTSGA